LAILFLVGEDGKAYQGCGWGKEGTHSISFNSKSIGICIIGDYRNKQSEIRLDFVINITYISL